MKKFIIKTACFIFVIASFSCKKNDTRLTETEETKIVSFKKIPFESNDNTNELHFVNNKQVTLYASTDTINSQIKLIENSPNQRIFLVSELDDFFEVNYFLYGDNPLSYKGFVKKEYFTVKQEYSLQTEDLNVIRYSNLDGVYNDEVKSFENYGTVKLINKATYQQNKSKGNTTYIFSTKEIDKNTELGIYSFKTNSGEQVEIPINAVTEETEQDYTTSPIGFSPILQSYVFKITENQNVLYAFYSKRNKEEKVQYKNELPVYNKSTKQFAELMNDNDVGCLFVLSNLDAYFRFKEKLLVNFVNFKIVPNTLFWISDNTLICEALHTNQKEDSSRTEYIMIQIK